MQRSGEAVGDDGRVDVRSSGVVVVSLALFDVRGEEAVCRRDLLRVEVKEER